MATLVQHLIRVDGDIKYAVRLWCSDPEEASSRYGHISKWDTSSVTDMSYLFEEEEDFNDDVSA
jgi:hypothetical protein